MELVKNHLRYAQSRAMNTEPLPGQTKIWGIKFDTPTRYWLYKEPDTVTKVRLPGVESSDGAVTLASIQLSGYPAIVSFDYAGSPGGSVIPGITVQPKGRKYIRVHHRDEKHRVHPLIAREVQVT